MGINQPGTVTQDLYLAGRLAAGVRIDGASTTRTAGAAARARCDHRRGGGQCDSSPQAHPARTRQAASGGPRQGDPRDHPAHQRRSEVEPGPSYGLALTRGRTIGAHVLGLALSAARVAAPPPVLPVPSRTGPEGPPRPLRHHAPFGRPARCDARGHCARPRTARCSTGRFRTAGSLRGVSDGGLLLERRRIGARRWRSLASARRARPWCAYPVDWRGLVPAQPAARVRPAPIRRARLPFRPPRRKRSQHGGGGAGTAARGDPTRQPSPKLPGAGRSPIRAAGRRTRRRSGFRGRAGHAL